MCACTCTFNRLNDLSRAHTQYTYVNIRSLVRRAAVHYGGLALTFNVLSISTCGVEFARINMIFFNALMVWYLSTVIDKKFETCISALRVRTSMSRTCTV